jgi:uncharacterized protein (UPF0332 family)
MTGDQQDLIRYRLTRATAALDEARLLWAAHHFDGALTRLYYASFYCVTALLLTEGLTAATHSGIRSLFGLHFVKPGIVSRESGETFQVLFQIRHRSDYEDFFTVDPETYQEYVDLTERLLTELSSIIRARLVE